MPEDTQEIQASETTESTSDSIRGAVSDAIDTVVADESPEPQREAAPKEDSRPAKETAPKDDAPKWDSVDPRLKTEFETTQKRWKDTQAYLTKQQQEWKTKETQLAKMSEYQQAKERLEYFDKIYQSNPEVQAVIAKALGLPQNQVDPDLQQDPLYQYHRQREQELMKELEPLKQYVTKAQEREARQEAEMRERAINAQVDKLTQDASTKFEELLSRKPTDEEIAKIYNHMVENKVYSGEAATLAVFFGDIMNAQKQAALGEQMKKKAVGTRVSSVNSGKAKSITDYASMDMKSIVASALEEQGII